MRVKENLTRLGILGSMAYLIPFADAPLMAEIATPIMLSIGHYVVCRKSTPFWASVERDENLIKVRIHRRAGIPWPSTARQMDQSKHSWGTYDPDSIVVGVIDADHENDSREDDLTNVTTLAQRTLKTWGEGDSEVKSFERTAKKLLKA